jgi:hypothetical protein
MKKQGTFAQELSDILIKNKVMSQDRAKDLQKAFAKSSLAAYEDFLLEEGLVSRDYLLQALSHYYTVPAFDVVDHFFDTHLLRKYPKDFLMRNAVIPLEVDENMVVIVAAEPERPGLDSELEGFASYSVRFFVGIRQDILDAIEQYYDTSLTVLPNEDDTDQEERLTRQEEEIIKSPEEMSDEDKGE